MICKCGAMVKARVRRVEITGIGPIAPAFIADSGLGAGIGCVPAESPAASAREPPENHSVQEVGTIEAAAYLAALAAGRGRRSLARSNSIRRSKAVERIIG